MGEKLEIISNAYLSLSESSQEYGLEAKMFVANRVLGEKVKIEVTSTDRYGRKIGRIYYGYGYKRDLNKEVVENGYAWW